MFLEAKMQLQHTSIEYTSESMSLRHLPFSIKNFESQIFIWWSSMKSNYNSVTWITILQIKLGSLSLVQNVRIKDIELIALNNLWRWIINIIVSLIVFIPFITSNYSIEKSGFSRLKSILPIILYLTINVSTSDYISKFLLILRQTFTLELIIHSARKWRIIKTKSIYVEPDWSI